VSVLVAVALDRALAEPRPGAHPVVWAGRYLDAASRRVPAAPPHRAVASGGTAWLGGAGVAVAAAVLVSRLAGRAGRAGTLVRGVALWPLLSARLLLEEVAAVEGALGDGLDRGRSALARIVSRDTAPLTEPEVRAAAIESLAENLSDSVVAPLAWYVAAGLPGAALHRYANTADACWGYRTARWNHAGRVAARADDALNLVPARLTALLISGRLDAPLQREARRTRSPNAGWPMAAMAQRLGVVLAKPGHYALNASGREPGPADVAAALRVATRVVTVATLAAVVAEHLLRRVRPSRGGSA
jgi:adenosylcobinamide-phosphate synthase